ncbi:MAG: VOC family protein [Candidatus Methanoplasma sp.]|jgi:catechol 2,3-dioxygenase-like lactoylglutathione lyase family enzyme|nr:VOC family protein [Candidatus Methanoplasma sp.]
MPLGDPGGGDFEYTEEGLPRCVFMVEVQSADIDRSIAFYNGLLGMDVVFKDGAEAVVRRERAVIRIRKGGAFGDTGVFLGVDDPYALHRRLIDEGVAFVRDPMRGSMGVSTSFLDPDGNILHAIETKAEPRPPTCHDVL